MDLSEFDWGQIMMVGDHERPVWRSSRTLACVCWSKFAVVSISQKCSRELTVVKWSDHWLLRTKTYLCSLIQIAREVYADSDRKVSAYKIIMGCCV